ncbi:hypothetical protein AB0M35_02260 [Micromonospora sp. NPDC051196]|uniref:hypothetical protein n=1 Tax=Micromonospora sp. NPDC051196 TaxID=3155281 RepID=UPI0034121C9F
MIAMLLTVERLLSRIERKRELFAIDPYYRDAVADVVDVWGSLEAAVTDLYRCVPVVFRADAVVAGRLPQLVEILRGYGLTPVDAEIFRFDRRTTREVWRYQLNIATRDRLDVMDMIMPAADSLYVLFRHHAASSPVPSTVELNGIRGPSRPESRRANELRSLAGPAQESVLTYVHMADEPADVLRELSVLFDRGTRLRMLSGLRAGTSSERLEPALRLLAGQADPNTLDYGRALDRLDTLCANAGHGGMADAVRVRVDVIRRGGGRDWRGLLAAVAAVGLSWSHWDQVTVAARLSARHHNQEPAIPDLDAGLWTCSAACTGEEQ